MYLSEPIPDGAGVSTDFMDSVLLFKLIHVRAVFSYFSAVSPHPEATADRTWRK